MSLAAQRTLFGHPIGLYILFFTEMWERFSYYGMRALLILYMVNYFKWTQTDASSIYKWYTSLVYLTPLMGGYLADRYLGNKLAIIIGAILMSVGHFLMAFESHEIFYAALVFLIVGNGFFKPNMSTQVGRLYPTNDPRRDSAYTIFYMGINLGAFLSPLVCGWLHENTEWGYHAGFAAAGVGMLIGLAVYLLGQRWVQEIPESVVYEGDAEEKNGETAEDHYMTEGEAATAPAVYPAIAAAAPTLLLILMVISVVGAVVGWSTGAIKLNNAVAVGIGGGFACGMGSWIIKQLRMAVRDRVLAIFVVAVFVVFFWSAFEQAGNAMTLFADKTTERYLTQDAPLPSIYPVIAEEGGHGSGSSVGELMAIGFNPLSSGWFGSIRPIVVVIGMVIIVLLWKWRSRPNEGLQRPGKMGVTFFILLTVMVLLIWTPTRESLSAAINPVPTEWFQSINALAIFIIAPIFAWMWIYLPKHGINLSIPAKIMFGVLLQSGAFLLMWWSISYENQPCQVALTQLPGGIIAQDEGQVFFRDAPNLKDTADFDSFSHTDIGTDLHVVNGGRIYFDSGAGQLNMRGVLADIDRDRILRATVTETYLMTIRDLALKTQDAKANSSDGFLVEVPLPTLPIGFDLRYAGFKEEDVRYEDGHLIATVELLDKDYKSLLIAGADSVFRDSLNTLYLTSAKFKVGAWWLFWFYILCTLGELCLSPVGLSMVSKLAPAKFATMLMGMWLLTSFFGNFFAGFAGEYYGTMHPAKYFLLIAAIVGGAAIICLVVVKKTKALMHGVN